MVVVVVFLLGVTNKELTRQDLCLKYFFSLFSLLSPSTQTFETAVNFWLLVAHLKRPHPQKKKVIVLPLYAHFKWMHTRISGDILSKRIRQPIQDIPLIESSTTYHILIRIQIWIPMQHGCLEFWFAFGYAVEFDN